MRWCASGEPNPRPFPEGREIHGAAARRFRDGSAWLTLFYIDKEVCVAKVRVGDIEMYYEEHGDAAAEPVLLIMGFGMNAAAWAPQIPALAERYRVIAFDNRGAGRTTQPEGAYTHPADGRRRRRAARPPRHRLGAHRSARRWAA